MTRPTAFAFALLSFVSLSLISIHTVVWPVAIGALIVIWAAALPGFLYLQGIDQTPVPFAPAVGMYYVVFFGLPIFATPLMFLSGDQVVIYNFYRLPAPEFSFMLLVAGAIAAMWAAFYLMKFILRMSALGFALSANVANSDNLNTLYWILISASLAYRYMPELRAMPSIWQFLDPVEYLALGGFYLQWRAGRLPRWQFWLMVLFVLPLEVYGRIRIFFLTDLLFLPMFFFFILWREGQKKALSILLLIGLAVALSYSVTGPLRHTQGNFLDKISAMILHLEDPFNGDLRPRIPGTGRARITHNPEMEYDYDPRISPLVHRIGQIWLLQMVYERSPEPVPYWGGQTYLPLVTALVPRFLYSDKPRETAGGQFAYRYNLSRSPDDETSINIPWITELLANFGPVGLLMGMMAIGSLLAILDKVFNTHGASDLEFLIGLTMIFRLAYPESNFSVMTGSMPLLFVALYAYFRVGTRVLDRMPTGRRQD